MHALSARREVHATSNDALLVVDANLNSYKTDPFMTKVATYSVHLGNELIKQVVDALCACEKGRNHN